MTTRVRRLRTCATVVACAAVLSAGEASLAYIDTLLGESRNEFGWLLRRFAIPWFVLALFAPAVIWLATRFDLAGPRRVGAWVAHALASAAVGVSHLYLLVLVLKAMGNEPAPALTVTASLVSRYLLQDVFLYWAGVAGLQAVWRQAALHARELASSRLAEELSNARLAALQARIEPHFLFNTLNTAVMLVRDGSSTQAVDVLVRLGELLRAMLARPPDAASALVPLETEWQFLQQYLAIEQVRFEKRLEVRMGTPDGCGNAAVPFLIVQPLVENALRHGIAGRGAGGPGILTVAARRDGPALQIDVTDNGTGFLAEPTSPGGARGRGLANVRERLRVHYGDAATLRIEGSPAGGTVAALRLPWAAASR
ncbi:MAG: histidine kinase [Vicinamibacterales bacterium]